MVSRVLECTPDDLATLQERVNPCAVAFPQPCWIKVAGIGLAVGALNGFFGVGGGFMIVPTLVLVLGLPVRPAVGTALTIIALISIGGIIGHVRFGALDPRPSALVITGSAAGILLGVRLEQLVSPKVMSVTAATITVGLRSG